MGTKINITKASLFGWYADEAEKEGKE